MIIIRFPDPLLATAVALVVGTHIGLDSLASPNYLALWEADAVKILARMERIRPTAAEIIPAIEPQAADQEG